MKTNRVIRLINQFRSPPFFLYFTKAVYRCIVWLAIPVILLLVLGCGKNDDPCSDSLDYTTVLEERLNALTKASEAYTNDPTPANCQQYKNSFRGTRRMGYIHVQNNFLPQHRPMVSFGKNFFSTRYRNKIRSHDRSAYSRKTGDRRLFIISFF